MSVSEQLQKFLKKEFKDQTTALRGEIVGVKEEIKSLREEVNGISASIEQKIATFEGRIDSIESEILNIKRNALKNNVIITGLKLDDSDLLGSVLGQLNSILGINLTHIEINNIYRLSKNKSIVKIEFISFLAKSKLIENRRNLKGSSVYINEDLCEEDRADFRLLRQQRDLARAKNYRAHIQARCLIVNGTKFTIEQLKGPAANIQSPPFEEDSNAESTNLHTINSELVSNASNSPAPVAVYNQLLSEQENLPVDEDPGINKESLSTDRLLDRQNELAELGRTRSQSAGSTKKTDGTKLKRGG